MNVGNSIGIRRRNQGKISTSDTTVFAPPDFVSACSHSNFSSAKTAGGFLPVLPHLVPPVDFAHEEASLDLTRILREVQGGVSSCGCTCWHWGRKADLVKPCSVP